MKITNNICNKKFKNITKGYISIRFMHACRTASNLNMLPATRFPHAIGGPVTSNRIGINTSNRIQNSTYPGDYSAVKTTNDTRTFDGKKIPTHEYTHMQWKNNKTGIFF